MLSVEAVRNSDPEIKISQAHFTQAEALVKNLRFRPFTRRGEPVAVTFELQVSVLPLELQPTRHVPFPKVKDWRSVKISLARSGCFGACPAYKVEVRGDGSVSYEGRGYVAFTGRHAGTVSQQNVIELVKLFEGADYFSLQDNYRAAITDNPTYVTSIEIDGLKKQIVDYVGLQVGMPMSVSRLEEAVDRLSGSERWTHGTSETLAALEAEHWDFKSAEAAATLARATQYGNADVVRDLARAGVPLTGEVNPGRTMSSWGTVAPLVTASAKGEVPMVRALLDAGAAANPRQLGDALVAAAESGNVEALQLLLKSGANSNVRDRNGLTLLMAAAKSGRPAMVKEVLKLHPEVNVGATPAPPECNQWSEKQKAEFAGRDCPEWTQGDGPYRPHGSFSGLAA